MIKTFKEEAERIVINLYLGKTFTEIVPNWRAELKNPKIDAAIEALQQLHDAEVAKAEKAAMLRQCAYDDRIAALQTAKAKS